MKKVTLQELKQNLTLTSVVFESTYRTIYISNDVYLTLTSVVFE